jgi:hypothetical protein
MKTASSSSVAGAGRGPAAASGTLRLRVAEPSEHAEFDQLLSGHHRLGSTRAVGDFLRVWVDLEGERVALLAWGPACYALRERDRWIGWTPTQRAERLKLVVQLRRFALLSAPGERPNLASRVLGAALKAVPEQWRAEFGYVPLLAETFSDAEAQAGTVYRATGWEPLGLSQGFRRHRQDFYVRGEGLKRLWAKPLRRGAAERLRAQELPPEHRPGAGPSEAGPAGTLPQGPPGRGEVCPNSRSCKAPASDAAPRSPSSPPRGAAAVPNPRPDNPRLLQSITVHFSPGANPCRSHVSAVKAGCSSTSSP